MIKYRILLLFVLCAASCRSPEKSVPLEDQPVASQDSTPPSVVLPDNPANPDVPVKIDTITVAEFVASFKEPELRKYSVDDIHYHEGDLSFFGTKRLFVNDSLKPLPISGYPKSFRAMGNGTKRITAMGDSGIGINICVYTVDKFYNYIDRAVLTAYGGDENVTSKESGIFLNDSTYLQTESMITYADNGDVVSVDTLKRRFVIHSNGKIVTESLNP